MAPQGGTGIELFSLFISIKYRLFLQLTQEGLHFFFYNTLLQRGNIQRSSRTASEDFIKRMNPIWIGKRNIAMGGMALPLSWYFFCLGIICRYRYQIFSGHPVGSQLFHGRVTRYFILYVLFGEGYIVRKREKGYNFCDPRNISSFLVNIPSTPSYGKGRERD